MLSSIIRYSLQHKLIIFLFVFGLIGYGTYASLHIPINAVPDITNNQVQVITTSRNLATEDVEKFLTYPVELEMANLPGVKEIRSISKFGLSVVTIVFDDDMGTYLPRQLIAEKIKSAEEKIPNGFGSPTMGPISTGLGEIYQYVLDVEPAYQDQYTTADLRTIQDWIVKRQLSGIPGIVEINTWGGFLKTYEVSVDPQRLKAMDIHLPDIFNSLQENNSIAGGSYIEKSNEAYFIRAEGQINSIADIENIVVENRNGQPILIRDVAEVGFGHANRFGAITGNGEGEKVMGQIMMLKGASSRDVIEDVKSRINEIQETLPQGVYINPVVERSALVNRTTSTIAENIILGCLIVIFIVILLLGNFRSGLVVASIIPLCLLFAISMMYLLGVDANLMSLGAIDFGIIIDGAVIIVEYIAFSITRQSTQIQTLNRQDRQAKMNDIAENGTKKMMNSAVFGQLIIIIVFIPILTLADVEGKMFRPMALTFCFALIGAIILCFTYVPVMASLFIRPENRSDKNISQRLINFLKSMYKPILELALRFKYIVLSFALITLLLVGYIFSNLGSEFVPTLDEGDFVIQPVLKTGMSLEATIKMTTHIEKIIKRIPEVLQVVSRIGAAEVPTDPMSMEESDVIITLKPRNEWTSAQTKDELADVIKSAVLEEIPNIEIEFTQPIEMRFNELISGVKSDLAIKLYGEDLTMLSQKAKEIRNVIANVPGASDIIYEKTEGLPQMMVQYDRQAIAKYGLKINDLNDIISMGFAGLTAGNVFEGERQFDLVLRYGKTNREDITDIQNAMIDLPNGEQLPLSTFAEITNTSGPAKISRDDTKRRIVVGVNVRGRDLQSVVDDVQSIIESNVKLPPGYNIQYGGQFENLKSASQRLLIAVPISLLLIFILLYLAFNSVSQAIIIYSAIPLASIGGILSLYLRGMPFSISAGVGFIALFGIVVLNGIVLIQHYKELKLEGMNDIHERVITGTVDRLRPVLLTASAAALGFLPMAISTSAGAEVQRPLATVVIGGLISATFLTLIILPILYTLLENYNYKRIPKTPITIAIACLFLLPIQSYSQDPSANPIGTNVMLSQDENLNSLIQSAYDNNIQLKLNSMQVDRSQTAIAANKQIEKTSLFYSYDRNNTTDTGPALHVLGASQSFKLPGYYSAIEDAGKHQTILAEKSIDITKKDLTKYVSESYYTIQYWNSLISEYQYLDSLYSDFEKAAIRKFELGESNTLEKITAQAKRNTIRIRLGQAEQNKFLAQTTLEQWVQSSEPINLNSTRLQKLSIYNSKYTIHPIIAYHQQEIAIAEANKSVVEKEQLPEINVSLFNGIGGFNDFKLYPGFEAGISLPLWRKSYKAKESVADIDIQIKSMEVQHQEFLLNKQIEEYQAQLKTYALALDQYANVGVSIQAQLIETAQRSYQGGEIDFFQFIQTLDNAAAIRINYIEQLHLHNQTVIHLNYLLN